MNSVIEMGERIVFLHKGKLQWQGTNTELLSVKDKTVIDFVFATQIMQALRNDSK